MTDFPNDFVAATTPLPIDRLGEGAAAAAAKLAAQGYEVHHGLTPAFADQILAMSQQPSIREFCPKDSAQRFADQAATKRWLAKGRETFLLLKRDGDSLSLVGYGWAGAASSPHVPAGRTTFAIRIGEAGQGQGLATPFAWLIVAATAVLYGAKDLWLETWASNGGAVHVYHKLGFKTVAEKPDQRPRPNGETVADTRLYMTIADDLLP